MMRLLGVLVGSVLAVGALVVCVGIPEFTTETEVTDKPVITLPLRSEPATQARQDETAVIESPANATATTPSQNAVAAEAHEGSPDSAPDRPDDDLVAIPQSPRNRDPQQWYAFWSPFRSEIAATGFVDQLQRVTGLDYRIVQVKPGVYEVAFAYAEDDDITTKLSQISAATGLELRGN